MTDRRGPAFRVQRQYAHVSLRELAKTSGISHPTISRWERGYRDIADPTYQHLVSVLADIINETPTTGATA